MNELLKLAQEHIDLAKKHLQDYIDDADELAEHLVGAHIAWANYYINEFYKEQQK